MSTSTDWSIGEVLKTASEKQVGFKFSYVKAVAVYTAISIVITLVQEATVGHAGHHNREECWILWNVRATASTCEGQDAR